MQFIPAEISRGRLPSDMEWFEQRRDFFMRRLLDDFFSVFQSFQELYQVYVTCRKPGAGVCSDLLDKQNEQLRNQIWQKLTVMVGTETEKGPLWRLKDLCHRLWPRGSSSQVLDGSLLDWLIGSVFHEAMKLKENIYLLNSYGPAAYRIGKPELRENAEMPPLARMMDINGLITRIVHDVIREMEQLAFLFGQAGFILRTMIGDLSQNMLVIRFLVEHEENIRNFWGEELESLFSDMFYGAPEQGFCAAGRSYLNGQWYTRALSMYQRAVDIDHTCDEAIVKMYQLKTIVRQNSALLGT